MTRAIVIKIASVGDSVWASVGDSVWASVRDSVVASVRDSVVASAYESVGASVMASVVDSVWASVRASVGDSVRASVGDSVWASVGDSVGDSVWASVRDSVGMSVYGQHDANWLSFFDYFSNELSINLSQLRGLWLLCKSAGWALPHKNICWVSERHNILRKDEQGRLHCENGVALQYPDGWSLYYYHGVKVPEWVIEKPHTITPNTIFTEKNAEIRRVMIEKFGREKFLSLPTCKKIHTDEWGTLYRNEAIRDINSEPYCFVKVVNSTPEPDGTFRDYILRVSPRCKTAQEAVQSTFPRIENFMPIVEK
ncbi:MAG: hypothetical protein JRI72_00330 [Deltaproteobacteria bacterium]|nr:hypothetical protein [Deltaproteobacteria bacterium]